VRSCFLSARLSGHQQIENALFGVALGTLANFVEALFTNHVDADLDQVANIDSTSRPNVADFVNLLLRL